MYIETGYSQATLQEPVRQGVAEVPFDTGGGGLCLGYTSDGSR